MNGVSVAVNAFRKRNHRRNDRRPLPVADKGRKVVLRVRIRNEVRQSASLERRNH